MIILSGIQPSGALHVGNYFGMMCPAIELQDQGEAYYFIADYHSMTSLYDPNQRRKNTLDVALDFLACGLDPAKAVFFRQSDVPEVCELTWLLSTITPMGLLERCHSYKDKMAKGLTPNHGLFAYPVLMAADILLYDATHVPVGDDQKQHLELCRDIAQKFNNDFDQDNFLQVPEPLIQKEFSRIMSLKDGLKKMSKSDPSDLSRINLTDTKDEIINKIKKAKTDSFPIPNEDQKLKDRPEAENLLGIYSSISDQTLDKTLEEFGGKNFSDLKSQLVEVLSSKISPISDEIKKLINDQNYLDKVLAEGAFKAEEIAGKKIKEMKKIIGF